MTRDENDFGSANKLNRYKAENKTGEKLSDFGIRKNIPFDLGKTGCDHCVLEYLSKSM